MGGVGGGWLEVEVVYFEERGDAGVDCGELGGGEIEACEEGGVAVGEEGLGGLGGGGGVEIPGFGWLEEGGSGHC